MRSKVKQAPLSFEVRGTEFTTQKMPFLEAQEFLAYYIPKLIAGREEGSEEGSILGRLQGMEKGVLSELFGDIFKYTKYRDPENNQMTDIVPDFPFDDLGEALEVLIQVMKFNYPDFFGNEADINLQDLTQKLSQEEKSPAKSITQI